MTRRSRTEWIPPENPGRRTMGRGYDPFYAFEKLERDDGKPYQSPEPKAERALLALLSGNATLILMSCLLAAVVAAVLVVVVVRL
jgi:hypothetical protein